MNLNLINELYDSRNALTAALLVNICNVEYCWISMKYNDNEYCEDGWFICGVNSNICFHMPIKPYWDILSKYTDIHILEYSIWDGIVTTKEVNQNILTLIK